MTCSYRERGSMGPISVVPFVHSKLRLEAMAHLHSANLHRSGLNYLSETDFGSGCLAIERFLTDPRLCVGAGRHISSVTDENIPTGQ